MNAKLTYKVLVLVIALAQLVLASVVGSAEVFKLGAVAVTTLGIASAAMTLVANYLPSLFGEAPGTPKP